MAARRRQVSTAMTEPAAEPRVDPRIEQTRRAVYAATLELISEGGLQQITVERIAERSGVSRSTIYRRWPSLARLYYEAFNGIVHRSTTPARGDTANELREYLQDYADRLNDPSYCSVLVALLDGAWRDPELARVHKELFNERSSRAAAILAVGMRAGKIRSDIDISEAIEALVSPFLYRRLVEQQPIKPDEVRRLHADVLRRFGAGAQRAR